MSSQSITKQQVFAAFFKLFEWAYDIRFRRDQKEQIQDEILREWSNADDSDKELLSYILELHDLVFGRGKSQHQRLKTQAQGFLKDIFSLPEINDRARILEILHRAIDELCPGVTQVPIIPKPAIFSGSPYPVKSLPNVTQQTHHPGTFTQPGAGASNSAPTLNAPFDPKQLEMEALHEKEKAMLEANLRRIQHDINMHIIGNIR